MSGLDKGQDDTEVERLFKKLDSDKSDSLSREEVKALAEQLDAFDGQVPTEEEVDTMMQEMEGGQGNEDGDGVDLEEFKRWWTTHKQDDMEAKVNLMKLKPLSMVAILHQIKIQMFLKISRLFSQAR